MYIKFVKLILVNGLMAVHYTINICQLVDAFTQSALHL